MTKIKEAPGAAGRLVAAEGPDGTCSSVAVRPAEDCNYVNSLSPLFMVVYGCSSMVRTGTGDCHIENTQREPPMTDSATQPVLEKIHIRAMLLPNNSAMVRVRAENVKGRRETAEEAPMNGQAETQSGATMRRFALPSCPKCNDLLCAPMASEFVSKEQVRHQWSCEACGHEFSTSVRLSFGDRRSLS